MAETILLIDPAAVRERRFEEFLESKGHFVVSCRTVDSAERELRARSPSLIICDLPISEIRELVARLVGADPVPVPVIAVSEAGSAQDVVDALRAGAKDFILKPVSDFSLVQEAVDRQLEQVRLYRLNQRYRQELEGANKELQVNLEELRADQRAGRHIQLKLFPERGREIDGLQFDHLIKPSLYLSGDFLDYFQIDERNVVFYLADVSGHGASSAFVTVLLKNLTNRLQRNLRRGSSDDLLYPVRILERVNKELLETGLGKHLTMFAGVLDTTSRRLTYSLGAHFPMPILKTDGGAEYLAGSGMPVGLFEQAKYAAHEIQLPPGFSLVLFSDGILEVLPGKNIASKEQELLDLVARTETSVESLERGLGLRDIMELPDDIAMMTITEATVADAQF